MENLGPDGALVGIAESNVASAAVCDIGAAATARVVITGATAITSFGVVPGRLRFIRFAAALTLTYDADDLILPGAANIITAAGDTAIAVSDAAGSWRVVDYVRADGRPVAAEYTTVGFVIDGRGAAITAGVKGDLGPFDFAGRIEAWTIIADQAGDMVIDIWKAPFADGNPVVANSITAAAKPGLAASSRARVTDLATWSQAFAEGDVLRFNVDSAATITWAQIALRIRKGE